MAQSIATAYIFSVVTLCLCGKKGYTSGAYRYRLIFLTLPVN